MSNRQPPEQVPTPKRRGRAGIESMHPGQAKDAGMAIVPQPGAPPNDLSIFTLPARVGLLRLLAGPLGLLIADHSGHNVQLDQPEAAVEAIVTMVEQIRRQTVQ